MSKAEQQPQPKTDKEIQTNVREGMTLGEASDISSMTILRKQAEQDEKKRERSSGKLE